MLRPMHELSNQFRDAVSAFLDRTGMARSQLGREALGDPSFVLRLMRGRAPRLATADRLLAFMGESQIGPAFLAEVEAFLHVTRTKPYLFGQHAAGDPSFVARLRAGVSPRLDTVQRVCAWMNEHCGESERVEIFAARFGSAPAVNGAVRENVECNYEVNGNGEAINMNDESARYLDTREAARFLGLSNRTLDRYRVTGEGPVFHRFGTRIRYKQADLDEWAAARRMRSTSDESMGEWRTV